MPAATLNELGLGDKTPQDLELIRREIIAKLNTEYKGLEDPEIPMDLLNRLAVVTQSLRRRNSGPPKVAKASKVSKTKAHTDDFLV